MIEQPLTPRDLLANLTPGIVQAVDWLLCWAYAWEWSEARGWCDGVGGAEFRRLTALAFNRNVPASQTSMRLFIKAEANRPPQPQPKEE